MGVGVGAFTPFIPAKYNRTDLYEYLKVGERCDFMSATCNGARKTRLLIVEKVHQAVEDLHKHDSNDIRVLDVDCWNHLINVLIGGM